MAENTLNNKNSKLALYPSINIHLKTSKAPVIGLTRKNVFKPPENSSKVTTAGVIKKINCRIYAIP